MIPLLQRLFTWVIRKIGWHTLTQFILLSIIFISGAFGLQNIIHSLEETHFMPIVLLALLIGWLLAHSRLPGWGGLLSAGSLGLIVILIQTARLGLKLLALARLSLEMVWQTGAAFIAAATTSPSSAYPIYHPPITIDSTPASLLLQDITHQVMLVFYHLQTWIIGLQRGSSSQAATNTDPIANAFIWELCLWAAAIWGAWCVKRWRLPLLGVLPLATLLAISMAFSGESTMLLGMIVFCVFLLLAFTTLDSLQYGWKQKNLDYAEDITYDASMWSATLATTMISLSLLISFISPQKIFKTLRELGQTRSQEATQLGESLGLEVNPLSPSVLSSATGELPRQHLLGAGPDLSQEIMMIVQVDGAIAAAWQPGQNNPEIRPYWRSQVYDIYTGRGWITSAANTTSYRAGQNTQDIDPRYQRTLRQHFQLFQLPTETGPTRLYYTGILLNVDQAFETTWLSLSETEEPQPFSASLPQNPANGVYSADSLVLQTDLVQLRSSGHIYPNWANHYLQLPPTLPQRVINLARAITDQAQNITAYDQARQIESYLRQFPYTLDIAAPPPDRDVVDYFLFDLKQGYCDYYATAMVVLARSAGLPARMVTGFASGSFDPHSGRFVVTAADAHSWVEIYFPSLGWVEFEPTSTHPEISFPEDLAPSREIGEESSSQQTTPANWQPWLIILTWIVSSLLGIGLLLILFSILDTWFLHRLEPAIALQTIYRRLRKTGRRLGLISPPGETPHEFSTRLNHSINELISPAIKSSRQWVTRWIRKPLAPTNQETQQVIDLYTRTIYSPQPTTPGELAQNIYAWHRLQCRLWLAHLISKISMSNKAKKPEKKMGGNIK